jgi:hypothetical protein
MPVILATWEAEIQRLLKTRLGNSSQNSISKITRAQWTGVVAGVVEHGFQTLSHQKKRKKRMRESAGWSRVLV